MKGIILVALGIVLGATSLAMLGNANKPEHGREPFCFIVSSQEEAMDAVFELSGYQGRITVLSKDGDFIHQKVDGSWTAEPVFPVILCLE